MRLRWLAFYPLLFAVAFVALALLLKGDLTALTHLVMGQKIVSRVLALAGCLWAVSVFKRGDELRWAWGWLAVNTALVLTRDVLMASSLPPAGTLTWLTPGLVVASNVVLPIGIWILVRSWKHAALDMMGKSSWAVTLGVVLLALVVGGPAVLEYGRALLAIDDGGLLVGNGEALPHFVSAVADTLCFCLLGQLLLAAIELRGGLLFWPWALLTACLFSWMLFDVSSALEESLHFQGPPLHEVFRGLAENLLCAAGVAQALVIRQVQRIGS